jgi:hypothetical protein
MSPRTFLACLLTGAATALLVPIALSPAAAQGESARLQLAQSGGSSGYYRYDRAPSGDNYSSREAETENGSDDTYQPPRGDAWRAPPGERSYEAPRNDDRYASQAPYGQPYAQPPARYEDRYDRDYDRGPRRYDYDDGTFSMREIRDAGHSFFGSVSKGLASVIEYAFQKQGRPNGYILGEDLGGAFIAGLRYGEGWLYTRDLGRHKVFWQGPSIGYDAGAEGSKVMVLVYNLRDPSDIYHRFGGVAGSAYFVGGVGITFQAYGDVVLAPIRSGIGLRLGANVGYLKYTPRPTWNPF